MAIRAFARDLLALYVSYKILRGWIYQNLAPNPFLLMATVCLLMLTLWFLLERLGVIPKLTT